MSTPYDAAPQNNETLGHKNAAISGLRNNPLDAIYALNIEDFISETFISKALLDKINVQVSQNPQKLTAQIRELMVLYPLEHMLACLGYPSNADETPEMPLNGVAKTICQYFSAEACFILSNSPLKNSAESNSTKSNSGLANNLQTNDQPEETALLLQGHSLPDATDQIAVALETFPKLKLLFNQTDRVYSFVTGQNNYDVQSLTDLLPESLCCALGDTQNKQLMVASLNAVDPYLSGLLLVIDKAVEPTLSQDAEKKALLATIRSVLITSLQIDQLFKISSDVSSGQTTALTEETRSSLIAKRATITAAISDLTVHQHHFLEALSECIDARYQFSHGNSKAVAELAKSMASRLCLNEKTISLIGKAALLSGLGKVSLSASLVNNPEKPNAEDYEKLNKRSQQASELLQSVHFLNEVVPFIKSQHEFWDGSGGPEKRAGLSIPLGARILALASAYVAMTNDRPYRDEKMRSSEAIAQLEEESGQKWDPQLVALLKDTLN
ncbi:MAG: HD domain-containing phosphohydrolase [Cyanobacteria bacterium P01_H01_bin.74]